MKLVKLVPFVGYFGRKKHTGDNIRLQLESFLTELGLDSSSYTRYMVLDNAANNRRAMLDTDKGPGGVFVTAASFLNIAAKTGIVNLSEIYYYEILANKHHLNSP